VDGEACAAERGLTHGRVVAERATAKHAAFPGDGTSWIADRLAGKGAEPIPAPFPNVAVHVEKDRKDWEA
jgi:hypothetical protein